jgi:hypothetical protein
MRRFDWAERFLRRGFFVSRTPSARILVLIPRASNLLLANASAREFRGSRTRSAPTWRNWRVERNFAEESKAFLCKNAFHAGENTYVVLRSSFAAGSRANVNIFMTGQNQRANAADPKGAGTLSASRVVLVKGGQSAAAREANEPRARIKISVPCQPGVVWRREGSPSQPTKRRSCPRESKYLDTRIEKFSAQL